MILTAMEIKNLAEYALGITIEENGLGCEDSDLNDYEYTLSQNVKVRDDDGHVKIYGVVVRCDGCDLDECMPISEGS